MYKILGSDGHEYGPLSAEKIKKWIAEERVEKKTPVLPDGADFAWGSAVCHQHSRRHNRELFARVFRALAPGGRIALRDVVMEPDRTSPREGALFAVNMLVHTDSGGTFTLAEYAEDLQSAGFDNPKLQVKHEAMNSVVVAEKP